MARFESLFDYDKTIRSEAQREFLETQEKEFLPYIHSVLLQDDFRDAIPEELSTLFAAMIEPPSFIFGNVYQRFLSEVADGFVSAALQPVYRKALYAMEQAIGGRVFDPAILAELYRRNVRDWSEIDDDWTKQGFGKRSFADYLKATEPYPPIGELYKYYRYLQKQLHVTEDVASTYGLTQAAARLWDFATQIRFAIPDIVEAKLRGFLNIDEAYEWFDRIGVAEAQRDLWFKLGQKRLDPRSVLLSRLQAGWDDDRIDEELATLGYDDHDIQYLRDAVFERPAIWEMIAYARRQENPIAVMRNLLERNGAHPAYWPIWMELAYDIPPVNDLIRMAVREVFSPEVAERFGQFEDYPKVFEQWALKKGLSPEWSRNYWAAHWDLPSPMQGFEMLHRGVIDRDTLLLLLRALDVMPFWRDKLIQIAYRPLSRVDVRRMYDLGVLSEQEVFRAYLDLGYNEQNAARMTEFTKRYVEPSQKTLTRSQLLKGYVKGYLSADLVRSELIRLGYPPNTADYLLYEADMNEYERYLSDLIKAQRNLYFRQQITLDQAIDTLVAEGMTPAKAALLRDQWYRDFKTKAPKLWSQDQVAQFYRKGLIDADRARQEYIAMGFDAEHVDVMVKALE